MVPEDAFYCHWLAGVVRYLRMPFTVIGLLGLYGRQIFWLPWGETHEKAKMTLGALLRNEMLSNEAVNALL